MDTRTSVLLIVFISAMGFACNEQSLVLTLDPDARLLRYSLATFSKTKKATLGGRRHTRRFTFRPPFCQFDRASPYQQNAYTLEAGTIRLKATPAQATIEGEATYTLLAHSATDQIQLALDVQPDAEGAVLPVEAEDPAAEFVWSDGLLTVSPTTALQADQQWTITIRWRIESLVFEVGDFPEAGGVIRAAQVSEDSTYFTWGYNYFPRLIGQDLPAGLRFEITHPQDNKSILSAQWVSQSTEGDLVTDTWQIDRAQSLVTLAIAKFKATEKAQCGDQVLEIYAIDQPNPIIDIKPETYTQILSNYCDDYIARFGQPSLATIRFCGVSDEFVSGFSAPGMIMVPNYTWDDDGTGSFDERDFFLAHELAHQWWGNDVWATGTDLWLIEGMADYLACSAMENIEGQQSGLSIWLWEVADLLRYFNVLKAQGKEDSPILADNPSNLVPQIYYVKGAWVLRMLEDRIGHQVMQEVLDTFRQAHPFSKATTAEFITLVQHNAPEDLQPFFEQWLQGTGMLDLDHHSQSNEDGILLEIQQNQTWSDNPERYFETPLTIELRRGDIVRHDRINLEAKEVSSFRLDLL